jgi:hypothetical protein
MDPAGDHALGPYRVVSYQVGRGNGRMSYLWHDLQCDRWPGGYVQQVAELASHHFGGAHLSVQSGLVHQEREPRRTVAPKNALLSGYARPEPGVGRYGVNGFGGYQRRGVPPLAMT